MSEDFFPQLQQKIVSGWQYVTDWVHENPVTLGEWYCQIIRWVMPILALLILIVVLRGMLKVKNPKETWGYLNAGNFGVFPINSWECTVGRAKHCDIVVEFPAVSRTQCALIRDNEDGSKWRVHNLSASNPTFANDEEVTDEAYITAGDKLKFGGVEVTLEAVSAEEQASQQAARLALGKSKPPWTSFIMLTLFQILTVIELSINMPDFIPEIAWCYAGLAGIMWGYVLISFTAEKTGFEPEILAFFACTLNLAITASSNPAYMLKETIAIILGVVFFLFLGWFLRDLERVVKARYIAAGITVVLLATNLVFGKVLNGAKNWIAIGGLSIQPSELAKIFFIFAGAATLERLFVKHNLGGFMLLSAYCLGTLALMSDFGGVMIFFVVFIVIGFLRSGDFATLSLITFGAFAGGLLILKFKPYIAARFDVWGHAWENASTTGFQQVRTMSASASGGLIGVGAGKGWLHGVSAADTDLVFGMICEEWGLIIALLSVFSIAALAIFVVRVAGAGRSAFYTTAACAATSLLVFQSMLNVFGSLDMVPLTGVTLPFISRGGSAMISAWGLLAFVKAADTRANASFAVRDEIEEIEEPVEFGETGELIEADTMQDAPVMTAAPGTTAMPVTSTSAIMTEGKPHYTEPAMAKAATILQKRETADIAAITATANQELHEPATADEPEIKVSKEAEHEIEDFLSSFDNEETEEEKNAKSRGQGLKKDEKAEKDEKTAGAKLTEKKAPKAEPIDEFEEFDELENMNKLGKNDEIEGFLAQFREPKNDLGNSVESSEKNKGETEKEKETD